MKTLQHYFKKKIGCFLWLTLPFRWGFFSYLLLNFKIIILENQIVRTIIEIYCLFM